MYCKVGKLHNKSWTIGIINLGSFCLYLTPLHSRYPFIYPVSFRNCGISLCLPFILYPCDKFLTCILYPCEISLPCNLYLCEIYLYPVSCIYVRYPYPVTCIYVRYISTLYLVSM